MGVAGTLVPHTDIAALESEVSSLRESLEWDKMVSTSRSKRASSRSRPASSHSVRSSGSARSARSNASRASHSSRASRHGSQYTKLTSQSELTSIVESLSHDLQKEKEERLRAEAKLKELEDAFNEFRTAKRPSTAASRRSHKLTT